MFSFVCSKRQLWQQSLAPGAGLEINIASFLYHWAHCLLPLHYLLHPPLFFTAFSFCSLSPSCHIFWKTGGTGVKLMWWKTTGISLWDICFAIMATLAPLSVALGFLLRLGANCKLASSYLRLPAKCIADPASLPSLPLVEPTPRPALAKTLFQRHWAFFCLFGMFKVPPETCIKYSINLLWHTLNNLEAIEFIKKGPCNFANLVLLSTSM